MAQEFNGLKNKTTKYADISTFIPAHEVHSCHTGIHATDSSLNSISYLKDESDRIEIRKSTTKHARRQIRHCLVYQIQFLIFIFEI